MFLSMHNWMRAEPIEVTIRRLAKYGYETIEIAGEPDKYDTKEVRRAAAGERRQVLGIGVADVRGPRPDPRRPGRARKHRTSISRIASRW